MTRELEPFGQDEQKQDWIDQQADMSDISVEFGKSALLKYFEHSFKDTDTIVKENEQYFESLQTVKRIVIFGHSLATVDEKYIRKINSIVSSKCNWFVFYRNASEKFEKKERKKERKND